MSGWREFLQRLVGFVARPDPRRVGDELAVHRAMLEDEYRARGLSVEDARRAARLDVGGEAQIAEAWRDQQSLPALEVLAQDVRYSFRMFARTPGFTVAAVLTLALGIGANTAIFSVIDAVLLRRLPYADPDRLVMVGEASSKGSAGNVGYATWIDWRARSQSFASLALLRSWAPTLLVNGEAELVSGMRVSANFFDLLGVRPALGRTFTADEDRPEQWRVLILSDALWKRRFGGDPAVIGRTIAISERPYRIIGVMPPTYEPLVSARYYQPAEIWAPLGYDLSLNYACRSCQHLKAIGRLRADVRPSQATAEMTAIHARLLADHPTDYSPASIAVEPLGDALAGQARRPLWVLFGAVLFVLLIACANVASLLLARSLQRQREVALRSALGAGRARLVRQLVTESFVLSAAGAAVGLAVAQFSVAGLARLAPVTLPRLDQVAVDGRVLAFTLALSALTALVSGLFPALRETALDLQPALTADSRSFTGRSGRARSMLVIIDLALALVLLTGAGLMMRTVAALVNVDPGFDPSRVATLQFSLVGPAYAEDAAVVRFQERLMERIHAVPGVERAALAGQIPLGGNFDCWGFHARGRMKANTSEDPCVQRYAVTPEYFRTMGIPIVEGRAFTAADTASSLPGMIVSRTTANLLWPGESPIGGKVRIGSAEGDSPWRTIVGVSGDVRHGELTEAPSPQMYLPQSQNTDSYLVLAAKVSTEPASVVSAVRGVLKEMDPGIAVYQVATMDELVAKAVSDRRFVMNLLGGFAAIAVLLAAIGLYGVVSYGVAQRTRELGVRLALGATPSQIGRLILTGGGVLVAIGLVLGLTAAAGSARFLSTLVYGIGATDPLAFAASVAVLASVAFIAHWLPVRRAMRIDPAEALRHE